MTPRMVGFTFEGRAIALRRERDSQIIMAWNIAALIRAKKLPDPKTLISERERSKPQSPEQQWAIFAAMAAQSRTQH